LASAADNILITSPNKLTVADSRAVLLLPIAHPILAQWANGRVVREQFLQSKKQGMWSTRSVAALLNPIKEETMEYLILVAVVSMMALYALIIVGCLKQPEW
jgi:hypothetical protein